MWKFTINLLSDISRCFSLKSPETVGFGCRSSSTPWKMTTTCRTCGTTGKSKQKTFTSMERTVCPLRFRCYRTLKPTPGGRWIFRPDEGGRKRRMRDGESLYRSNIGTLPPAFLISQKSKIFASSPGGSFCGYCIFNSPLL